MLTNDEMRDLLRKEVLKMKNASVWARAHGVNDRNVRRVLCGDLRITPAIAKAIGYERKWVKIDKKK